MGKAALVANPLVVDLHILAADNAPQLVSAAIQSYIAAHRTVHADAGRPLNFPGAVGKTGDAICQRPDRTKVDYIAAGLGVYRPPVLDVNDRIVAPFEQTQLRFVLPLLKVANAAPAKHAPLLVQHNRVRNVVMFLREPLRLDQLADPRTEPHRLVLQRAFAAFVADRAIQRMIEQNEGKIRFLHRPHLFGIRPHNHAVAYRHRTGGHHRRTPRTVHLDQAHAAAAYRVQLGMRTEHRNLDARHARRVDQKRPGRNRHFLFVDGERYVFSH